MIPDAARIAVDTAIDDALERLASRATKHGESMSALTAAVSSAPRVANSPCSIT